MLIILILLLFSCSTRQESKQQAAFTSDSTLTETINNIYDSVLTIECLHKNLFKDFDLKVFINHYFNTVHFHDSCLVKLMLIDKSSQQLCDSVVVFSHFFYGFIFKDCNNVLSYSTKVNTNKEIVDNYFGDIIVADLNFDGKEDMAVVKDVGGNGGTFNNFYIQNTDKKFILNAFLTDSMTYFPHKINKQKRTLVTYVHAGACGLGENIYQLDKTKNKWTEKSHRIINVCDE